MKKVFSLRRQGMLLLFFGIGVMCGSKAPLWSVALLIIAAVVWLMAYDSVVFEKTERKGKK